MELNKLYEIRDDFVKFSNENAKELTDTILNIFEQLDESHLQLEDKLYSSDYFSLTAEQRLIAEHIGYTWHRAKREGWLNLNVSKLLKELELSLCIKPVIEQLKQKSTSHEKEYWLDHWRVKYELGDGVEFYTDRNENYVILSKRVKT